MKKLIPLLLLLAVTILSSCTDDKTFFTYQGVEVSEDEYLRLTDEAQASNTLDPKDFKRYEAEAYGWANSRHRNRDVEYDISVGNVVLSIIFCETVIVPIILTGWYLYDPAELKH